jgi:1-deoxy-D-xylulose-5-phosphate reductoisomerase
VKLFPVDSEHSAVFQCIQGLSSPNEVKRVILTASGGPFYGCTAETLNTVTVEQALKHPNWSMGSKITIDSATLMNKGLEVIEARWLFGMKPSAIDVVVHRQSVVHSMVELMDHSVLAQLGCPDMRIPIQYALTYPRRLACPAPPLDILNAGTLTFGLPDRVAFPCLELAYGALRRGGGAAVALNAANEVAVDKFLKGGIPFNGIPKLVEKGMALAPAAMDAESLADILALDAEVRKVLA